MENIAGINRIEFTKSKRNGGYDTGEVDEFLNKFAAEYQKMQDHYAALVDKYKRQAAELEETIRGAREQQIKYESQIAELKKRLEEAEAEKAALPDLDFTISDGYQQQYEELKRVKGDLISQRTYYESQIRDLKTQLGAEKKEKGAGASPEIIAKALIDAETLAANIVEKAKAEADRINSTTKREIEKITGELNGVKRMLDSFDPSNK